MNQEKRLIRNTAILIFGKICTQCVSFFMIPLYTKLLTPEDYGIADLITTYISVIIPLVSLQSDQGLFRIMIDYRDSEIDQNQCLSSDFIGNFFQIIVFWVIYAIVQAGISLEYKVYIVILVPMNVVMAIFLQYSRGIDKNTEYSVAVFLFATSQVCLNVLFIAVLQVGVNGLFYAMIGANMIGIGYLSCSLKIWRHCKRRYFNKDRYGEILQYSLPLIPNQVSWWIINVSDRLIISHVLGTYYNGIYSIANKFSIVYITLYNYFNLSWTESVILAFKEENRDDFLYRSINIVSNLLFCSNAGIIICMSFIFRYIVNSQFHDAYNHIPILMYAAFFQAIQGLYGAVYVALKKTSELAKTSALAAFINVIINIGLIKYIGLYAASISTFFAFLAMTVYRYFDLKKYINASISFKRILCYALLTMTVLVCYNGTMVMKVIPLFLVVLYFVLSDYKIIVKMIVLIKGKLMK